MERQMYAAKLFAEGHNCAQAVAVAFCDVTGLTPEIAAKLTSSFGGGMGRLGEVCGAVSGMLAVAGILYGGDGTGSDEEKKAHYARVRELAERFRAEAGSLLCRDILKDMPTGPVDPALEEILIKRPCARLVVLAVRIMEQYIQKNPV